MRKALVVLAGVSIALAVVGAIIARPRPPRVKPERPDCHLGVTTPGIDVSYYQDVIDWARVRRAGIRFAFIRVSDGTTQRDPRFAINWAEAKRSGIVRGAYQFFRPDQDVLAQADLMVAAMSTRNHDDLPPALDLEVDAGLPATELAARAGVWIDRVRSKLRVEPIIYTGSDLWRTGGAAPLALQALWIAHYTQGCPTLPAPWPSWTFWQTSDRGAVPGIEGPVDLDLFAGTLAELHAR